MKKGVINGKKASHVGVVLSFVIFITFIIFLFSILNPVLRTSEGKERVLGILERESVKYVSNDLTSISIRLVDAYNPTYDRITSPTGTFEYGCFEIIDSELGITETNSIINSSIGLNRLSDRVQVDWSMPNPQDIKFFKIYYSDEEFNSYLFIVPQPPGPEEPDPDCARPVKGADYIIGLTKTELIPFGENLNFLISEYDNNYESLKNRLEIPDENNFRISFTNSKGIESSPTTQLTTRGEVFTKNTIIQYVDKDGNILSGSLNLMVW